MGCRTSLLLVVATALQLGTAGASAQALAAGGRAGTLGLGAEAALRITGNLALRGGIGAVPGTPSATFSGIEYEVELPSPLATVGADLLLPAGLRLFGGVLFGIERTDFTGRLAQSVRIGGRTYTPAEAGTLLGSFRGSSAAPFAGLGFGHYGAGRVGVTLDLGAAYFGEGDLLLSATGPFRDDPTFRQELEQERLSVQEDLRRYSRFLPLLSLGLHVTLAR